MSIVMFAMLCDHCQKRSEEYQPWPSCRNCMDHVCPDCSTNHDEETGKSDCYACSQLAECERELNATAEEINRSMAEGPGW